MLALVLLPALLVVSSAAPGGYTGYGGLYPNMNQNADYMAHAKNAAKLASQIAFEEDESLSGAQVGVTNTNSERSKEDQEKCATIDHQ